LARKTRSEAAGAAEDDAPTAAPSEFTYRSQDGLLLSARVHGSALSPWLPVVCLPGLTRNSRDFDELAQHLANHRHRPRRVVAFDLRGRGRSAWDRNIQNYNPLTEMGDVLDGMAALGIPRAAIVGTSRGGIIAMLMAVARPSVLAGVVLNDIGPAIEPHGLVRIKSYVGRVPKPDDWADAAAILKRLHGGTFTALSDEDWDAYARATFRDENGQPAGDYDPALSETLAGVEFDKPLPSLWNEFKALRAVPVLVIRGENSDLLSPETLAAMGREHPRLESITVRGQGHAPLLRQPALLQRISAFVTSVEDSGPESAAVVPREPAALDLDTTPED
jgi:pimeloyl-ACP methyl ester carboxylesterase